MPAWRLAYLLTHPIQYQAPLLRAIAAEPDIDLEVFYCSDMSLGRFQDPGFGQAVEWDVPLLEGYRSQFLPGLGSRRRLGLWRPLSYGLAPRLRAGGFEALWVHGYARPYHLAAVAQARRLGLKVLLRDEATEVSAPRGPLKRLVKRAFFAALRQGVDAFLAIGSLNAAYYRAHGVPDERIFRVPYAVDNAHFRSAAAAAEQRPLRAELGLEPGRPVALFVGKLIARKRPLDLLEAYARLAAEPPARLPYLLLAGDGDLRGELERRAAGLEGVRLLGFRGQRELPALYALADVLVLPSEREAWGLVVNEAMNAGTAVIASDRVGAAADLVREGDNGYVYPVGDAEALAAALRRTLADPAVSRRMGARSREIIDGWGFREDIAGLKAALAAATGRRP